MKLFLRVYLVSPAIILLWSSRKVFDGTQIGEVLSSLFVFVYLLFVNEVDFKLYLSFIFLYFDIFYFVFFGLCLV